LPIPRPFFTTRSLHGIPNAVANFTVGLEALSAKPGHPRVVAAYRQQPVLHPKSALG
jgi:hypothetical protein